MPFDPDAIILINKQKAGKQFLMFYVSPSVYCHLFMERLLVVPDILF